MLTKHKEIALYVLITVFSMASLLWWLLPHKNSNAAASVGQLFGHGTLAQHNNQCPLDAEATTVVAEEKEVFFAGCGGFF